LIQAPGAPTSQSTVRYDVVGFADPIYAIQATGGAPVEYYTKNTAGELIKLDGVAQAAAAAAVQGLAPTSGGVTANTTKKEQQVNTEKTVDDQKVKYGENTQQRESVGVLGNLVDLGGATENLNTIAINKPAVITQEKSVETGIIDSTGGVNTYGTVAKSKDTATDGTVTADKTATLTADGIVASDAVTGNSTIVTAEGITTSLINGNGVNGALVLHGGTNSTTQTLDDNGVKFVTTDVNGNVTGTTAIDANGNLTVKGVNVTDAIATNTANIDAEAATRVAADTALNTRVDQEVSDRIAGDAATLASANAYTNTQVANVNSRVNQLNSRVDDVEKTSYRGIAIALAAQQQIPNIGAGQFAVFGGVGHYEGESAGALGLASVFADGRTSVSAAVGFAGGNEVGGRVGVSYVFGGK